MKHLILISIASLLLTGFRCEKTNPEDHSPLPETHNTEDGLTYTTAYDHEGNVIERRITDADGNVLQRKDPDGNLIYKKEENIEENQEALSEDFEAESFVYEYTEDTMDYNIVPTNRPVFDLMLTKFNVENIREHSLEFLKTFKMNFPTHIYYPGSEAFFKIPQCSLSMMPKYLYLDYAMKNKNFAKQNVTFFNHDLEALLNEFQEIKDAFEGDLNNIEIVCGRLLHSRNENGMIETKLEAFNITRFLRKAIEFYESIK